jgi:hypothetical protein
LGGTLCKIGSPLLSFLLCSLCTPLQVLFHTIYNEPIAGDRAHCALASAFAFAGRVVV